MNTQAPHPSSAPAEPANTGETLELTVGICTYNGAKRVGEVLECLAAQEGTGHLRWEVLVVDNKSTDDTAAVVSEFQSRWTASWPLRYCLETRAGTAYARRRTMAESSATFVGFLDDDNLPDPHWVAEACAFLREHPEAGGVGSRLDGEFETEPPEGFERIKAFFALTDMGDKPRLYPQASPLLPPAAGLALRRDAWLRCVPDEAVLTGPVGERRVASEDLEAAAHITRAGWEFWHNPRMRLRHKIPAGRFDQKYLMNFFRAIGLSRHVIRMLFADGWKKPVYGILYFLNDLRRILLVFLRHGSGSWKRTVPACELQLHVYSLISPFYSWIFLRKQRSEADGSKRP